MAMLNEKSKDLQLGPGRDGKKRLEPSGIKGSALTPEQRAVLVELIGAWVNMLDGDAAAVRMTEIKGKLDHTYFGWNGPTARGAPLTIGSSGPRWRLKTRGREASTTSTR